MEQNHIALLGGEGQQREAGGGQEQRVPEGALAGFAAGGARCCGGPTPKEGFSLEGFAACEGRYLMGFIFENREKYGKNEG